ncbi:MAG: aldehyde dehydrogenase family protein, partial [Firmicutes bacterium]|nr:aldehyde dehydrogenase family protein [Bacillota bacterium]
AGYVASRLDAGMIGINTGAGGGGDTPWVGAKMSGYGYHGSPDGHRQFTQPRVINEVIGYGEAEE